MGETRTGSRTGAGSFDFHAAQAFAAADPASRRDVGLEKRAVHDGELGVGERAAPEESIAVGDGLGIAAVPDVCEEER